MRLLLFSTFIALWGISADARKFVLDPAHSSIEFSVKHLGLVPVRGKFKVFNGSFDLDEKTGQTTNLVVRIDVDSINTNEEDRDAHLKSKDFFHVRSDTYDIIEKNRYIEFRASSPLNLNSRKIKGNLKILKTSKTITLNAETKPLKTKQGIEMIGVQANGQINRQHFGLTWQKPSTGLLAKVAGKFVGNEVTININALAQPAKEKK